MDGVGVDEGRARFNAAGAWRRGMRVGNQELAVGSDDGLDSLIRYVKPR